MCDGGQPGLLELSFVGTITGEYVDFSTAQHAALRMMSERTGTRLDPGDADKIVEGMRMLPPHPEVRAALETLRGTGLRITALTNSPLDVAEDQLADAGLQDLFDTAISADSVCRAEARGFGSAIERGSTRVGGG